MEMSNDKTITETLPMNYKGWVIKETTGVWAHFQQFKITCYREGDEYESLEFRGSIEEAKELIDEKQN